MQIITPRVSIEHLFAGILDCEVSGGFEPQSWGRGDRESGGTVRKRWRVPIGSP